MPLQIAKHYDKYKHRRRSIRLKGYDYAQKGAYFVTICTQNRECLFGDIVDGEMRLNDAGQMVHRTRNNLSVKYPDMEINEFVVMPNHVHEIIVIVGAPLVGAHSFGTAIDNAGTRAGVRRGTRAGTRPAPTAPTKQKTSGNTP